MGARSNTVVVNGNVKVINMYRQFDGYPTGHGAELANFLAPLTLVNGYSTNDEKQANGMGCLAAQLVANFKDGIGGIYLEDPQGDCDNDYTYTVKGDTYNPGAGLHITVQQRGKQVFAGSPKAFVRFCKNEVLV